MANPPVKSQTDLKTPQSLERFPLWVSLIVILGALLTITGAVISKLDPTLLTDGSPMTEATRVYADYLFARNLALAVMLALIQLLDVGDDLARGAFVLVPGLLVFAIVFLLGAWRLFRRAVWHIEAWRESDSRIH